MNVYGCDSIVNTSITINVPNINVTQISNTLNAELDATAYQWVICDSVITIITNETNVSFSPSIVGSYAVLVTLGSCISQSNCFPMVLTSSVESYNEKINLYPNPAQDIIILPSMDKGDHIKITNLQGMLVMEFKVINEIEKINISKLNSGMYFISNTLGKNACFVKY